MMGRKSTRENKSIFQQRREELGLTREKACDLLGFMTNDTLLRIECGKQEARPEEVLAMAKAYQAPWLCNHYCSSCCAIGRKYVPEAPKKDLPGIVLQMISTLNAVQNQKDQLIDITADGLISPSELQIFTDIQKNLEKLSLMVESLQLWAEEMLPESTD